DAWRADYPLSRRKLRLGIQLARRRRPEAGPPQGFGQGLGRHELEPIRNQRVHGLVQSRRDPSFNGTESWNRNSRAGGRASGVLQHRQRYPVERIAAEAWL